MLIAAWHSAALSNCPKKVLRFSVMAGLVPAIHDFLVAVAEDVDARDRPWHDELEALFR